MRRFTHKFGLVLFIVILFGFVFLLPKVTPRIIGFQRKILLDSFVKNTLKNKQIDPVEFWRLREFYSPGVFDFRKYGYGGREKKEMVDEFDLTSKDDLFPFLNYESPKIQSIEALIGSNELSVASGSSKLKSGECVLNLAAEKICRQENRVYIYFTKPIGEMKKANAFYDYADENTRKLLEGKYWFVAAIIEVG